MSLQYLNGIGAPRRKSGGSGSARRPAKARPVTKAAAKRHPGALKRIVKAAPKNPVAAAKMAKRLIKKHSPLNAIRVQKALRAERQRAIFEQGGEPLFVDKEELEPMDVPQEVQNDIDEQEAQGIEEVDAQEFDAEGTPDSEDGGADMGVIYPGVEINGKKDKPRKQKKAAKTDKKKASAESKRIKAQAKLEKAKQGGGKAAALFNKGLDTANKYLDTKKGAPAEEKEEKKGFFEENKGLVIGGGLGLAALFLLPKLMPSR